jgi:hypothetical protein
MVIAGLLTSLAPAARAEDTTGSVRGTVTVAGYPIPKAKIFLHPDGGKTIASRVRDGAFVIEKVPTGTLRVSVEEEGLAKRYADAATSGLSIKIKGGANEVHLKLAAEGIEVGRPVPALPTYGPDGNAVHEDHWREKYVVLAFWYAGKKDPSTEKQFTRLREIRREFAGEENLLIISVCVDMTSDEAAATAWNQLVTGTVDYGNGKRRYIDDSRWWQCMDIGGPALPSAPRYGVDGKPETFLIGPDGRFIAVRIPPEELRRQVAKAVGRAR